MNARTLLSLLLVGCSPAGPSGNTTPTTTANGDTVPQPGANPASSEPAPPPATAAATKAGVCSADGWCWQNPLPQGNKVSALWGAAANDLLAVGAGGTALRYDGKSWRAVPSGVDVDLNDVAGASASDAWAVGAKGTILHFDGSRWSAEKSGTGETLHGAWAGGGEAFVVGMKGTVLRRQGSAWSTQKSGVTDDLRAVWGSSANDVFAVGRVVLHWDGKDWKKQTLPMTIGGSDFDGVLHAVWGSGADAVLAVGWHRKLGPVALRFDGKAWSLAETGEKRQTTLFGVSGQSASDAIAVGSKIALRWDGKSWTALPGADHNFLAAWSGPGGTVMAAGEKGVLAKVDHDKVEVVSQGATDPLDGVWGSGETIVAVGLGGVALHWEGGRWLRREVGTPAFLRSVWGKSADDIVAVGDKGTAARWDGKSWRVEEIGKEATFEGVSGADGVAFAVGQKGALVRHDGKGWRIDQPPLEVDLVGVWASSKSDAWAVGKAGTILRWDGSRWSKQTSGTDAMLYGIWAASATDVYAVGDGVLLHFDGKAWQKATLPRAEMALRAVSGRSATDVWVVGYGTAMHWDGKAWKEEETGMARTLRALWLPADGGVVACGDDGALLRRGGR
jgi:hypothetical protein